MKPSPELAKLMRLAMMRDCSYEIREVNLEERSVVHYASTKTPDSYESVFLPSCFDLKRFQKNPVVLYCHDYYNMPIGRSMWQKADKTGLLCKTQFVPTPVGDDLLMLYSNRFMQAWSVGGWVKNAVGDDAEEFERLVKEWQLDGKFDIIFKEFELFEYSVVPVPANPDALTEALRDGKVKSEVLIRGLGDAINGKQSLPPKIATAAVGAAVEGAGPSGETRQDPPEPEASVAAGLRAEFQAEIESLRRDLSASRKETSELRLAVTEFAREKKNDNRQDGPAPSKPVQKAPAPDSGMRMIAVGELADMIRQAVDRAVKQARGQLDN